MIPFNQPTVTGLEGDRIADALKGGKLSGDGVYGRRCEKWFTEHLGAGKAFLTPSCTSSLEMAALVIDIAPGDEVIMPSYTFVSTANAFVLRGATMVFIDIRPETMNLDEREIESAITPRTRAIVPVHYAGVGCEMDAIAEIAKHHGIAVIEDAAQGINASFRGRPLGSFGNISAFSFHDTKNLTSGGEGGLAAINDASLEARAEVIREKGTNRTRFFRGEVDKYTWVDIGSSFLLNEVSAAYLWAQLENIGEIQSRRMKIWRAYDDAFAALAASGRIGVPHIPAHVQHNAHMYYIKCRDLDDQTRFLAHMKARGIGATFHYVPLHTADAGRRFGRFHGKDVHTTRESQRLIRLPLYYNMKDSDVDQVITEVNGYFFSYS